MSCALSLPSFRSSDKMTWNCGEKYQEKWGSGEDFKFIAMRSSSLKDNKGELTGFQYVTNSVCRQQKFDAKLLTMTLMG